MRKEQLSTFQTPIMYARVHLFNDLSSLVEANRHR